MNATLAFTRILFVILSVFFITMHTISAPNSYSAATLGLGVFLGLALGAVLISFDLLFKRFTLRSFNTVMVGLLFGYLMGEALVLILKAILDISSASIHLEPRVLEIIQISLFLFGIYLGTLMTLRSADELSLSIPFVKFIPTAHKKRDLIVDSSVLSDARIIDLSASGLVDHHLVIPRFVMKELHTQTEGADEMNRNKAKRALEVVKKLEAFAELELRYSDIDFPDINDPMNKMIRLARLLDANILTSDISRIQMAAIEGVRVINIHSLSNSLKPLMQMG